MIAVMINNKKLHPVFTDLFIYLSIYLLLFILVFITKSYFQAPKDVRLNTTNIFLMKRFRINKSFNRLLSIIHLILSLIIYRGSSINVLQKTLSLLVIDLIITLENALSFWKNRLEDRVIMTIDKENSDEKLQYKINRTAAKIPTLFLAR